MTSREAVRKAIRHNGPDRIPVANFVVDWQRWQNDRSPEDVKALAEIVKWLPNDSLDVNYIYQFGLGEVQKKDFIGEGVLYDEWGVGWRYQNHIMVKQKHPMIDGWKSLDALSMLKPDSPERFAPAKEMMKNKKDKYVLGWCFFTIFERMWFIRGMENMLCDHILEYDNFKKLRDIIVDYDMQIIDNWIKLGVDGIFFSDDWGSQHGPLINPNDWREHYKPCYKILFDKVKSAGIDVWMHLDGNINPIIPDLIEVGLDVYNPVQNQVVDIDWLKKEFGGHLAFNGGVDVQVTLPVGTPKQIKDEVDRMVDVLGSSNGGLILAASHTIMPDTPLRNMEALVDAMLRHTGPNNDIKQ